MTTNVVWHRNQQPASDRTEEDLLVFGYSCKIFRDDEKATFIDEGKHLIPWMGNDSVMIDRYDVRGYLHDLVPYEAKGDYEPDQDTAEEEALCEEERYLALRSDVTEEELYHVKVFGHYLEEEMKRLRAAVASDGAYHEIGFSYDSVENANQQTPLPSNKDMEPLDEPYIAPEGLTIPKGMQVPSNMKIHAIIEKTAFFISQQGGQMEVIIRMKQSDNPQFAFMCFDNPLHPYYKFLVQELKAGRYKPIMEKKSKESDDDHHDGHYLHPSLVSRKADDIPKFTVPSINFRRTGDDSYSLLVKNLKQSIVEDAQRNSPTTYLDSGSPMQAGLSSRDSTSDSDDSSDSQSLSSGQRVVPPPPDIQPIIDKMAEYVAKNGEDFETIVRSKRDKRFEFLNEGHKYYNYYVSRRNSAALRISRMANPPERSDGSSQRYMMSSQTASMYHLTNESIPPAPSSPLLSSMQSYVSDYSNVSYSPDNSITSFAGNMDYPENRFYSGTRTSPELQLPKCMTDYEPDTTDTIKSSGSETPPNQQLTTKTKTLKGPISFSLRAKELESQTSEKTMKRAPLLLDDSEGEDDKHDDESAFESDRRRKASKDHDNSASSHSRKSSSVVDEEKPRKPTAEELEAKLAEEKIKTKIMAAAREKLVQQKRDKQLQLERKQKAALFLKMLQAKKQKAAENANNVIKTESPKPARTTVIAQSNKNGSSPSSPSMSDIVSPDRKEAITSFPPSPPSLHHGRSRSPLSEPGLLEHGNGIVNERLLPTSQTQNSTKEKDTKGKDTKEKTQSVDKSHSSRSKSHKSSKTKKRRRSRSRSSSGRHHKDRSPPRKEKKLPSAYALQRRSRSKSRSPKRYGFFSRPRSPLHWSRYRP